MQTQILESINSKLRSIETSALIASKTVYTMDEAAVFLGLTKDYLYKLVSRKEIPYFKPANGGRTTYFNRSDLEAYAMAHRIVSNAELEQQAIAHVVNKPMNGRKGGAR